MYICLLLTVLASLVVFTAVYDGYRNTSQLITCGFRFAFETGIEEFLILVSEIRPKMALSRRLTEL